MKPFETVALILIHGFLQSCVLMVAAPSSETSSLAVIVILRRETRRRDGEIDADMVHHLLLCYGER